MSGLWGVPRCPPVSLSLLALQLVNTVSVHLYQRVEQSRRRVRLQHGKCLARHALARKPRYPWVAALRNSCAVPIFAGAVATEQQLVFVPLKKISRERRIHADIRPKRIAVANERGLRILNNDMFQ